ARDGRGGGAGLRSGLARALLSGIRLITQRGGDAGVVLLLRCIAGVVEARLRLVQRVLDVRTDRLCSGLQALAGLADARSGGVRCLVEPLVGALEVRAG